MTARCLRCGAGNEWIEGKPTLKADPAADPEVQARVLRAAAKNYGTNDPAMAARLTSYAIGVSIKPLPVEEERTDAPS